METRPFSASTLATVPVPLCTLPCALPSDFIPFIGMSFMSMPFMPSDWAKAIGISAIDATKTNKRFMPTPFTADAASINRCHPFPLFSSLRSGATGKFGTDSRAALAPRTPQEKISRRDHEHREQQCGDHSANHRGGEPPHYF